MWPLRHNLPLFQELDQTKFLARRQHVLSEGRPMCTQPPLLFNFQISRLLNVAISGRVVMIVKFYQSSRAHYWIYS